MQKGGSGMIQGYTSNVCIQMLIALLKKHGIRRAVISPGGSDLELAEIGRAHV